MTCKIIPIRKKEIIINLYDKEIDDIDFLCFLKDKGYEQLFVKLARKEIKKLFPKSEVKE